MDSNLNTQLAVTPAPSENVVTVLFKNFVSCKGSTLAIKSVKGIADIQSIIQQQAECLTVIDSLNQHKDKLEKYQRGIDISASRIKSEQFFLTQVLAGNTPVVKMASFTMQNVREKEQLEWKSIESKIPLNPADVGFHPSAFLVLGWVFFIIVIILLLMKGKDQSKPLPLNSESVKLYFKEERAKFSEKIVNFFRKDENDKK
jgi:hypothetical protein